MASFLTLLSRYFSKKSKYTEKQKVKTNKEKKESVSKFEKQMPAHAERLKAWEKYYGEKKEKADSKHNNERKTRVLSARSLGPSARKKVHRSTTTYMVKDPFTSPPIKKTYAKLTSKKKVKREASIRKMNTPKTIKEANDRNTLPPIRNISQSLIDAVIKAQQTTVVSQENKALDMGLKPVTKTIPQEQIKEVLSEERKRTGAIASAFLAGKKAKQKTLQTDGKQVTYHGNVIAKHEGDEVHVTTAGYGHSPSTRGHINGILDRLGAGRLHQKKHQLMHNDKPIGSKDWIKVKKTKAPVQEDVKKESIEQPQFIQDYNAQMQQRQKMAYTHMLEKAANAMESANPVEASQLRQAAGEVNTEK